MSDTENLAITSDFEASIHRFCVQVGWSPAIVNAEGAKLNFRMHSGREYAAYIAPRPEGIEIIVNSVIHFDPIDGSDSNDALLNRMAFRLMQRSGTAGAGAWCVIAHQDHHAFAAVQQVLAEVISAKLLASLLYTILDEVDSADTLLLSMLPEETLQVPT